MEMRASDWRLEDLENDRYVLDMGPAQCGDGIVESGEGGDDGNGGREPGEAYRGICRVCGPPQCQRIELSGPVCANGIHQMRKRWDVSADHAETHRRSKALVSSVIGGWSTDGTRGRASSSTHFSR